MPRSLASLRAEAAALHRWANEDPVAGTQAARDGRWKKYLAQVDARCPGLPEEERQRRANAILRAEMADLRVKRAEKARRKQGRASTIAHNRAERSA